MLVLVCKLAPLTFHSLLSLLNFEQQHISQEVIKSPICFMLILPKVSDNILSVVYIIG
jgi:hypothetical protein